MTQENLQNGHDARSLTQRLVAHLMRPVDDAARSRARLHLLDWIGCVGAARQSPIAAMLRQQSGDGRLYKPAWLGNAYEMDDVHRGAIVHPGPIVWPALLSSLGQHDMTQMLTAGVRGYEAMITIGSTFDAHHYAHYHPTTTAGNFGAAAAIACLNAANQDTIMAAIGLAGSVTGGLWQMRHEASDTKQWHVANAVDTGRNAAHYAALGITGPAFILEGPQGFHAATCSDPKPMVLTDHLRIFEMSFKPWGACRHAHPAIDAALALKAKIGALRGDVMIESYKDSLVFCDQPNPVNAHEAKFSIQHSVAVVVARGAPTLADFEPKAISELAAIRGRVSVQENPDITAAYPAHYGATIHCDGDTLSLSDTLGDPERPLPVDGIIDKARQSILWGGLDSAETNKAIKYALEGDDPHAIAAMLQAWLS